MAVATKTKKEEIINRYRTMFDLNEQQLNGQINHPLHRIRQQAMKHLENIGFPDRKDEDYKYTNVSRIAALPFAEGAQPLALDTAIAQQFRFDQLDAYQLTLVNGILDEQASSIGKLPEGLTISTLQDAYQTFNNQKLIEETLKSELGQNAFVSLNTAFAQNGLLIKVEKNTIVPKPIHISHISTGQAEPVLYHPQILLFVGDNSEVELIETFNSSGEFSYFNNPVSRITVEANAHVHHYKLQNENETAFQINNTICTQERDSSYSSYVLDIGGKTTRNNLSVHLKASGTTTNLYGTYIANGSQHIDNQTFIDHAFPHCQSNELYKGILDDKSRGVFNGKVNVRQDAQKTNAFQQNSSLVLSDSAVMDAKPQLEIFADDVRCSHGATIGQLDENSVYYLRTRGMNLEQAKSVLQFAFIAEVLEFFKLEAVKNRAHTLIEAKLKMT